VVSVVTNFISQNKFSLDNMKPTSLDMLKFCFVQKDESHKVFCLFGLTVFFNCLKVNILECFCVFDISHEMHVLILMKLHVTLHVTKTKSKSNLLRMAGHTVVSVGYLKVTG